MSAEPTAREVAAAWEPQRPGRRAAKNIVDPLVEPAWGGIRVAAALTVDEASLYRDGEELEPIPLILAALVAGFTAVEAVIEGHLTTEALASGIGVGGARPKVERPPLLVPRGLLKPNKDDPYVKARDYASREAQIAMSVLASIEDGVPHAFVATDLLWLDGTPLADVPLMERHRLLEGALQASELVRVTPVVKPLALTLVTWGQLGFTELSYRSSNSRYTAGKENPDWAVSRPPEGPGRGPARAG